MCIRDRNYILSKSLSRAEIVITCGGIGPTKDDITRDIVAKVVGKKLVPDQESLDHINNRFRKRGMIPTKNNDRQAHFPEGSIIVKNPNGTAPSFIVEKDNNKANSIECSQEIFEQILENELSVVDALQEKSANYNGDILEVIKLSQQLAHREIHE